MRLSACYAQNGFAKHEMRSSPTWTTDWEQSLIYGLKHITRYFGKKIYKKK